MKVALAEQMRAIDQRTQVEFGIPGTLLMERAALALIDEARELLGELVGKRIYLYCGKGNNGGDGLAAARLFLETGAIITGVLLFPKGQYRGLAMENLERAAKYGVNLRDWETINDQELQAADLIIDAVLGTGAVGPATGVAAAAIERINCSGRPVLAVDLPSGIGIDSGEVPGPAVRARRTVTFGLAKPGLLIFPGAEYAGDITIKTIGFPSQLLEAAELKIESLSSAECGSLLPRRKATAHKGSAGHVLVIGGSSGMTGALALATMGALRSGGGLVTAALRPGLSFPEKPLEIISGTWQDLGNSWQRYSSIVIGPGLSTAPDGAVMLAQVLNQTSAPLIIDADGLNLLASGVRLPDRPGNPTVLTPHPGEMSRLTGLSIAAIQADRMGIARRFASQWGVTVVLKGARTVIAAPDGSCYINVTGNPGMATAGMGDVLAGVIGGLIAQGLSATTAAVVGCYLHGLAGDRVAARLGMAGLIADDLLPEIPQAMAALRGNSLRDSSGCCTPNRVC